jgi:polyphosphate glucokinase
MMATIHKITSHKQQRRRADRDHPASILAIDIGGSKVKILAAGQTEPRKMRSDKELTPAGMVEAVRGLAEGWDYEAVSIGYPGMVGEHGPRSEPGT